MRGLTFLAALTGVSVLALANLCAPVISPASAQETPAAASIPIRIGQQANFTRIVFDFPQLTAYKADPPGKNDLSLTFKTTGVLNFPKTRTPLIRDIWAAKTDPATAQIGLDIAPGATFRHYRMMKKVIIDIYPPKGGVTPAPEKAAEKKEKPAETKIAEAPKPEAVKPPEKTVEKPVEKAPEKIVAKAPEKAEAKKPEPPASEEKKTEVAAQDSGLPDREKLEKMMPADPAVKVDVETLPPQAETAEAADTPPTKLRVASLQPSHVAAFTRGNALWIVLDAKSAAAPVITGDLKEELGKPHVVNFDKGTAWRYALPDHTHVHVDRRNMAWEIDLTPSPIQGMEENQPSIEHDEETGRTKLVVPLRGTDKPLSFVDPEAGDMIRVVTTGAPVSRVDQARRFPSLEILPAAAGLAVVPRADDVHINRIENFTFITSPDGIVATPGAKPATGMTATGGDGGDESRLFDFTTWRQGGIADLNKNRRLIEKEIAAAPSPEARSELLMRLALLYFANNFGQETLGVLNLIEQENENIVENPNFIALRGAAAAMAGHFDEAMKDLSNPAIQQHPEVSLWTGFVAAATEQWQKAGRSFPKDNRLLSQYPPDIRIPFTLYMAEASLRLGRTEEAARLLENMGELGDDVEPRHKAALSYLKGEVARQEGKPGKAVELWKPVSEGIDRLFHTKAGLALANLELQEKKIDAKTAIDRIDSLRFAWRGDGLEVQTLHNLGLLKTQNGQYLAGMQDLKTAAELAERMLLDPEPIRADITRTFNGLFPGQSDKIQPLEAISIFNEFKDLIPQGEGGSEAMLQAADYMIRVDLLEKAAAIYEEQIDSGYLPPAKIADTGARLAAVYLLEGRPEQAIAALDRTGHVSAITEKQREERLLLRARALSDLKRTDEAAAVLSPLASEDAQRLRTDLYWRARRWGDAAKSIEAILPQPSDKITKEQADLILNAAVAYKLAGDSAGLDSLKKRYAQGMAGTEKGATFNVVTRDGGSSALADRETIMKVAGEADLFRSFLDNYKAGAKTN